MVKNTYINARLIIYRKLTAFHPEHSIEAVCEVKIWQIPESIQYPFGIKYSLFCVNLDSKEIIIGFDNHYPKGPHVHEGNVEKSYMFLGYEKLTDDF